MHSHAQNTHEPANAGRANLSTMPSPDTTNATGPLRPRTLVPIFLIIAVDTIGLGILLPLLPFYTERTGASAFTVGALISVYAFCSFLAAPVLGQLSDRFGRKPILLLSQLGSILGFVVFALSNTLWLLFVARIIDGLSAGNLSVAQAYVADNTSASDRTRAFGIMGAAFGVGLLIGPAIGGLLAAKNIHAPIWVAAGLSATSLLGTVALLPKGKPSGALRSLRALLPAQAMIDTFRATETGLIACLMTLFYFALGTYVSGQALFLAGRFKWNGHPFNAENVGLVFTYGSLINVLVQAVAMKHLLRRLSEKTILIAGFLTMAVGLVGVGLCSSIAILVGFITITNLGGAVLRPIVISQLSKRVAANRQGLVMGVNQAIFSTTAILSPLLSGLLINRGLYTSWALCAASIVCVGSLASLMLKSPALITPE